MKKEELMQYYDYLIRLANSKCDSRSDAEDLVSDTVLAAIVYLKKGGSIDHPKTWLSNVLAHKHNERLRKKYRSPITVCLDDIQSLAIEDKDDDLSEEEQAAVRKELNYLSHINREVMVRFYYGNQSVEEIAEALGVPKGTVKSRLFAGRDQIKKGLTNMKVKENQLPGRLLLSYGGAEGLNGEPYSLIENDLIAENLLMLAYEKPISITDLSRAIGIPAAYIEPIVKRLIEGELMAVCDNRKVYTDFIISKPENMLMNFKPQYEFAVKHFDILWQIIEKMNDRISKLEFVKSLTKEEAIILERYTVLKALQDFEHFGTGKIKAPSFPSRKDGGRWFAQAIAFDAGFNMKEYSEAANYAINGGHRTTEAFDVGEAKRVWFYEFDTALFDSPNRFGGAYNLYFKHIIPLLWSIYKELPLNASDIPDEFIEYIPTLERFGLIGINGERRYIKIPVIKREEYREIVSIVSEATEAIKEVIGNEYSEFVATMKTPIPKHLKSVPELFRYLEATKYIVMSIVKTAYDKGLHLKDVDYCCPPCILVYEE